MLPVFAIVAAVLGLSLIVFLIYREEGAKLGSPERMALFASVGIVLAVGIWQIVVRLPGSGGGGH